MCYEHNPGYITFFYYITSPLYTFRFYFFFLYFLFVCICCVCVNVNRHYFFHVCKFIEVESNVKYRDDPLNYWQVEYIFLPNTMPNNKYISRQIRIGK